MKNLYKEYEIHVQARKSLGMEPMPFENWKAALESVSSDCAEKMKLYAKGFSDYIDKLPGNVKVSLKLFPCPDHGGIGLGLVQIGIAAGDRHIVSVAAENSYMEMEKLEAAGGVSFGDARPPCFFWYKDFGFFLDVTAHYSMERGRVAAEQFVQECTKGLKRK